MSKTYKVIVNDGKGEEAKSVAVVQGSGVKGSPTKIEAKRGFRYELQDDGISAGRLANSAKDGHAQ